MLSCCIILQVLSVSTSDYCNSFAANLSSSNASVIDIWRDFDLMLWLRLLIYEFCEVLKVGMGDHDMCCSSFFANFAVLVQQLACELAYAVIAPVLSFWTALAVLVCVVAAVFELYSLHPNLWEFFFICIVDNEVRNWCPFWKWSIVEPFTPSVVDFDLADAKFLSNGGSCLHAS